MENHEESSWFFFAEMFFFFLKIEGGLTCNSRLCWTWEKSGGLSLASATVMVIRTAEESGGSPSSAACTVRE